MDGATTLCSNEFQALLVSLSLYLSIYQCLSSFSEKVSIKDILLCCCNRVHAMRDELSMGHAMPRTTLAGNPRPVE